MSLRGVIDEAIPRCYNTFMDPQIPVTPQSPKLPLAPILLLVSLTVLFLGSTFYLAYQNLQLQKQIKALQTSPIYQIPPISPTPINGNSETIVVKGKIVKEQIPKELDLGEYWYWMYFDSPFLLQENASGIPQRVTKLEVSPPADMNEYQFEQYLNSPVEILGDLTWGYAESSVIQVHSIHFLNQKSTVSCQYNGKTYREGESFKDSCNSCSCESGQVACTLMACAAP